ncbi:hypothetical protein JCM5350_007114 [Sporobolomyces pararoseus]
MENVGSDSRGSTGSAGGNSIGGGNVQQPLSAPPPPPVEMGSRSSSSSGMFDQPGSGSRIPASSTTNSSLAPPPPLQPQPSTSTNSATNAIPSSSRTQLHVDTRPRTSSAPQPQSSESVAQPHSRSLSTGQAKQNSNSGGSSASPSPRPYVFNALYKVSKETSGQDAYQILEQARREIVKLATTGGIRLEADLEAAVTLPALRLSRLPTSQSALDALAPHMGRLLVGGIRPEDYLRTFQRWHQFIVKSGDATFPICGPTVAAFLQTSTQLAERPRLVWILDQYRKATVRVFENVSKDEGFRKRYAKIWGEKEWNAWDRFIALSQIKLGAWKIIEELAPPVPVNSARSTPTDSRHPSPAVSHPSQKALGKRRADDSDHSQSDSSSRPVRRGGSNGAAPSSVHPYGLNRYGQPRQKPFHKRKLPPEERKADEEFYVAVQQCAEALRQVQIRMRQAQAEREGEPGEKEEEEEELSKGQRETERQVREQRMQVPPSKEWLAPVDKNYLRPTTPSSSSLPRPYSDHVPSLAVERYTWAEPILATFDPPPLSILSTSLPRDFSSLLITSLPLPPNPAPLIFSSPFGFVPDTSSVPRSSYPRLTLTPHHFLPYPKSLTLSSKLSEKDQLKTLGFAQGMAGHPAVLRLETQLIQEGVGTDERERRKKVELEKIVKNAIAESKPRDVSLSGREPREPEAAKQAREVAKKLEVKPIHSFPHSTPTSQAVVEQGKQITLSDAREGKKDAVENLTQPSEVVRGTKQEETQKLGTKRRRAASEEEVDELEVEMVEKKNLEIATSKEVSPTIPKKATAPPPTGELPARPVTVVPTLSISPADPAPSPSMPTNPSSTSDPSAVPKPRRPSFSSNSVSAPVVPQQAQRSRSKSTSQEPPSKLRRRTSITTSGPGVHPLALLYASQSPQFRQGARLKAAEIVAATKNGIIPAAKSPLIAAKVLSEGAVLPKASPRIVSGGSSIGKSPRIVSKPLSPPLVPIPLPANQEGRSEPSPPREPEQHSEGVDSNDQLQAPSVSSQGSSALGVILELPSPQQASVTTSPAPPRTNDSATSAPDPIPPIPVPAIPPQPSTATPPLPSSAAVSTSRNEGSQVDQEEEEEEESRVPTVTSNFTRLVRRLSSNLNRPESTTLTESNEAIDASPPAQVPQPVSASNLASSALSRPLRTPPPNQQSVSPASGTDDLFETTSKSTKEVAERRKKAKGKGKEKAVEPSTMASPKRPSLLSVKSPSGKKKAKELSGKSSTKDKTERKVAAFEVVPPPLKKVLQDHPLRRVSKSVLAIKQTMSQSSVGDSHVFEVRFEQQEQEQDLFTRPRMFPDFPAEPFEVTTERGSPFGEIEAARPPGAAYKPVRDASTDLIHNSNLRTSRIILLKTSTLYESSNSELGGIPSALIGFSGLFQCDPPDGPARFRQVLIDVPFVASVQGLEDPTIRAIVGGACVFDKGSKSTKTLSSSTTVGLNISFSKYGGLQLSNTQTETSTFETQASLQVSGVGTNYLKILMSEDSTAKRGVFEEIQVGVLLSFEKETMQNGFQADMKLEVNPGPRWIPWKSRPKEWILCYDPHPAAQQNASALVEGGSAAVYGKEDE